jgi:hypothetical protein
MRLSILSISVVAGLVAAHPGAARDCRPIEAPPGVRLPQRAGCKSPDAVRADTKPAPARTGRAPGFMDLGNGTQVRIGGEVGVEVQGRR